MARYWDPTEGWNGDIYCLSAEDSSRSFFRVPNYWMNYTKGQVALSYKDGSPFKKQLEKRHGGMKGFRYCAGNFCDNYYYGSFAFAANNGDDMNQGVFVANRKWKLVDSLLGIDAIEGKKNKYFTGLDPSKSGVPFRDPERIPGTNTILVVTGGFRWRVGPNLCSLKFANGKLSLDRETVLGSSFDLHSTFVYGRQRAEIEKPSVFGNWMFISSTKDNCIYSAIEKKGVYDLHAKVRNSENKYGATIMKRVSNSSTELYCTYWRKKMPLKSRGNFTIVVPDKPNLVYRLGSWEFID